MSPQGFGRRICVGRHVANNSVYIDIVSLLWACDIAPLKDAAGKPIMPDTEGFINDGLVLYVVSHYVFRVIGWC